MTDGDGDIFSVTSRKAYHPEGYNKKVTVTDENAKTKTFVGFYFFLEKNFGVSEKCRKFAPRYITNKESEVLMPEFEHNRRERMEAVIKDITSSKEKAIQFLQEVGIMDATGNLAPMYR